MAWSKRQRIPGFYGLGTLTKSMNSRPLKDHVSKEIDAENDTQGCPLSTIHTIHKLSTYIYTHKYIWTYIKTCRVLYGETMEICHV